MSCCAAQLAWCYLSVHIHITYGASWALSRKTDIFQSRQTRSKDEQLLLGLKFMHLFEKLQTHLLYIKFLKYLLVLSVSRKQTVYFVILQFEN